VKGVGYMPVAHVRRRPMRMAIAAVTGLVVMFLAASWRGVSDKPWLLGAVY
jgi:hypothetical protein